MLKSMAKNPITAARDKRGWSVTRTASECGVGEATLRNLEGIGDPDRGTDPSRTTVRYAFRIIEGLWPDVPFSWFAPESELSVSRPS